MDPTLFLFSGLDLIPAHEYMKSQINRFPALVHKVLLHDVKGGV
jgi:hypothetical protein